MRLRKQKYGRGFGWISRIREKNNDLGLRIRKTSMVIPTHLLLFHYVTNDGIKNIGYIWIESKCTNWNFGLFDLIMLKSNVPFGQKQLSHESFLPTKLMLLNQWNVIYSLRHTYKSSNRCTQMQFMLEIPYGLIHANASVAHNLDGKSVMRPQ